MNELLRRTAAEIRRCRGVVVQLEDAVHALIDTSGARVTSGPLADLQAIDARIDGRVFAALSVEASVAARASHGGTAPAQVRKQVARARAALGMDPADA